MSKKIALTTLVSMVIFMSGCSNEQASNESTKTQEQQGTITEGNDQVRFGSRNNSNTTTGDQSQNESNGYQRWNGSWRKGQVDAVGDSGLITIYGANEKQFKFTLNASFITKTKNEDGNEFLNPHLGKIEGTAYFSSSNEASYTNEEFPNYKMVFTIKDHVISVKELNTTTNDNYGQSPYAGTNVRYSGDYALKN